MTSFHSLSLFFLLFLFFLKKKFIILNKEKSLIFSYSRFSFLFFLCFFFFCPRGLLSHYNLIKGRLRSTGKSAYFCRDDVYGIINQLSQHQFKTFLIRFCHLNFSSKTDYIMHFYYLDERRRGRK